MTTMSAAFMRIAKGVIDTYCQYFTMCNTTCEQRLFINGFYFMTHDSRRGNRTFFHLHEFCICPSLSKCSMHTKFWCNFNHYQKNSEAISIILIDSILSILKAKGRFYRLKPKIDFLCISPPSYFFWCLFWVMALFKALVLSCLECAIWNGG